MFNELYIRVQAEKYARILSNYGLTKHDTNAILNEMNRCSKLNLKCDIGLIILEKISYKLPLREGYELRQLLLLNEQEQNVPADTVQSASVPIVEPATNQKPGFFGRVGNFFRRIGSKIYNVWGAIKGNLSKMSQDIMSILKSDQIQNNPEAQKQLQTAMNIISQVGEQVKQNTVNSSNKADPQTGQIQQNQQDNSKQTANPIKVQQNQQDNQQSSQMTEQKTKEQLIKEKKEVENELFAKAKKIWTTLQSKGSIQLQTQNIRSELFTKIQWIIDGPVDNIDGYIEKTRKMNPSVSVSNLRSFYDYHIKTSDNIRKTDMCTVIFWDSKYSDVNSNALDQWNLRIGNLKHSMDWWNAEWDKYMVPKIEKWKKVKEEYDKKITELDKQIESA